MRITYHPDKKSKGLGDTIEKITTATGIKKLVSTVSKEETCKPCEERKNKLNEMFPYGNK